MNYQGHHWWSSSQPGKALQAKHKALVGVELTDNPRIPRYDYDNGQRPIAVFDLRRAPRHERMFPLS